MREGCDFMCATANCNEAHPQSLNLDGPFCTLPRVLRRPKLSVLDKGVGRRVAASSIGRLLGRAGDMPLGGQPIKGYGKKQQGLGLAGQSAETSVNFDIIVQTHLLLAEAVRLCVYASTLRVQGFRV